MTPIDLEFSTLTPKDSDECFALHVQGQFSPWSKRIFDDCLTNPYFAFRLEQNAQLVGYYIAMTVLDEVTLMDIVVNNDYQGRGHGKALLQHLIEQCNQNNIQQLWLEVRESNVKAISLYEAAGFVLVEQRVNYYPSAEGKEDAFIMCSYLG